MNQEEALFQHPQYEFKHHYHQPAQAHYYLDPSLQIQKHHLHSEFLNTSLGFECYPSVSLSTPSNKTDQNISSLAQINKHLLVCVSETTSRLERRKCYSQPTQRRHAVNMRERRRMQSITCAFEGLRAYIPKPPYEQSLSKLDTLRLAVRYIDFLSVILRSDMYSKENGNVQAETEKVIIHSATSIHEDLAEPGSSSSAGYSLSWLDIKRPRLGRRQKTLVAKVWTPEDPRTHIMDGGLC